jgi:hypothetical protein
MILRLQIHYLIKNTSTSQKTERLVGSESYLTTALVENKIKQFNLLEFIS